MNENVENVDIRFWQRIPITNRPAFTPNIMYRTRWAGTPPPRGCRWCGSEERGHGQRWIRGRGYHVFTEPTQAQNAARLWARFNEMRRRRGMRIDTE